jgi:hypothetical protein
MNTITESACTSNARSRMATARDLHNVYGFTMKPTVDAANSALVAAHEARVIAREAWDHANTATDNGLDANGAARTARDNANRCVAAADLTAGVVSSVACCLHGVTFAGDAFTVVSTDHGRADLRGVEYLEGRFAGREVEGPEVVEVAHFFATKGEARSLARLIASGLA